MIRFNRFERAVDSLGAFAMLALVVLLGAATATPVLPLWA